MKKNLLLLGVGVVIYLIFKGTKTVKDLKNVTFSPAEKPFELVGIQEGLANFDLNLTVGNPSDVTVNIPEIELELKYKGTKIGAAFTKGLVFRPGKFDWVFPVEIYTNDILPFVMDFLTTGKIPVDFKMIMRGEILGYRPEYDFTIDVKSALRDYMKEVRPQLAKLL